MLGTDGTATLPWRSSSWLEVDDKNLIIYGAGVYEAGSRGSTGTETCDLGAARKSQRKTISAEAYRLSWPVKEGE